MNVSWQRQILCRRLTSKVQRRTKPVRPSLSGSSPFWCTADQTTAWGEHTRTMLQLPGRGPTNKFHGVYGVSANGFGSLGRVDSGVLGISSHPIHVFNHLGGGSSSEAMRFTSTTGLVVGCTGAAQKRARVTNAWLRRASPPPSLTSGDRPCISF